MNRAVHGDIVVVEVFSEQEWKSPTDEVVDQECESVFHISLEALINLKLRLKMTMPTSRMKRERGSSLKRRLQEPKFLRERQLRNSQQAASSVSSKGTGERRCSGLRYGPRSNTLHFQLCLPHRLHHLEFVHDNIAFSTDCVRNPSISSPPAHTDAHSPGTRADWSKDSCDY